MHFFSLYTCGLHGAFRHTYDGHQNIEHRTETPLKRRYWVFPVSSFLIWWTRVAISLYSASSSKVQCIIKRSGSNGRRAGLPHCWKRRCTARVENDCSPDMSISWIMVCDVTLQFCRVDLTKSLSSLQLIMEGL